MKATNLFLRFSQIFLICGLAIFSKNLSAELIPTGIECNNSDVQLTSIVKQEDGATPIVPPEPLSASDCLGAYSGNDPVNNLGSNLGYRDEGFLNDTTLFPEFGAFVGESDLQDLQTPGEFVDPGWIFLSKYEYQDDGSVDEHQQGSIGDYTFDGNADFLSLECAEEEGEANCSKGTFVYKPPQFNEQELLDLLGAEKFFDQVAVVFKASDEFAIYNFKLSDLISFGVEPVLGTDDENYMFSGSWDISNTLMTKSGKAADISHISLWARDPSISQVTLVPEPLSILIFSLGLLALGYIRLR